MGWGQIGQLEPWAAGPSVPPAGRCARERASAGGRAGGGGPAGRPASAGCAPGPPSSAWEQPMSAGACPAGVGGGAGGLEDAAPRGCGGRGGANRARTMPWGTRRRARTEKRSPACVRATRSLLRPELLDRSKRTVCLIQACSLIKPGNRLLVLAPAILPIWPNRLRPGAPIGPRWFLAGRGVSPPAHTGGVTHRFFIARFPRVDARFCMLTGARPADLPR